MSSPNKIISFKLDQETIQQLMNAKNIKLDVKKNEAPELVLPEARVKLDIDKQSNATATYYNNKSTNLHYFGSTMAANATMIRQVEKQRTKSKNDRKKTARGVESLDIPSVQPPTSTTIKVSSPVLSPPLNSTPKSSSQKKSNLSNNNIKSSSTKKSKPTSTTTTTTTTASSTTLTNNTNIPRTPQSNTPRPSSTPVPNEKLSDRVVQLLALRPYQISTMAKILDCTQWDVKKIVDDVALLLPDPLQKKKYCLKPHMYKKTRIWDWPSYTHEEKLTVFDNVTEAYQLLQIPVDSPERNNLINPASPSAAEKYKLIQPPPGKVHITTERDRAIAAKKSSNSQKTTTSTPVTNGNHTSALSDTKLLKPEKRNSPDSKGSSTSGINKGKTTPSGFTYTATTPEPPAPSPSTSRSSPSSNKLKPTQRLPASQQLKPSSSNKKVGSKGLPQPVEKSSPPMKRKIDHARSPLIAASTPAPPTVATAAAGTVTSPATSNKRLKPSSSSSASSSNDEPHDIELLKIVSQSMFDKYCAKFITSQKDYQHTKTKFMAKFPHYIRALETTEPPKSGIKRSYYDTKVEYYDMVKENFLKTSDESSWKEAEAYLNEWNQKRRRLNYMWNSIEKNMTEHRYQLNRLS